MASLAGMFYIMALYLYAKRWYIPCFIVFLLALLSKENAILFPASAYLYTLYITHEGVLTKRMKVAGIILAAGIVIGFFGYFYADGGSILSWTRGYANRPFTLHERVLTQFRVLVFYISLLLYPMPYRFSIEHNIPISASPTEPITTVFALLFILGLVWYCIEYREKKPLFAFCVLFFFLNHAIEGSILPLELVFEHRNYIPSFVFFVPIVVWLLSVQESKLVTRSILALLLLTIIAFGQITYMQNFTWQNDATLWINAIKPLDPPYGFH